MNKVLGIIPARYDSTRLKGKMLAEIGEKTVIQRVFEQVSKSQKLDKVVVATDDERIYQHIESIGGNVMMTSKNHQTGTDRCAEVAKNLKSDYNIAINIQGDEPFINPNQIDDIVSLFNDEDTQIATLAKKIETYDELVDEKEAKVVLNKNSEAIYMSRSPIPYLRNEDIKTWHEKQDYYKHIGIYGFKIEVLENIASLPQSFAEKSEGLEQLRWMAFYSIKVGITHYESFAIDTAKDLEEAKKFL